MAKGPEQLRLTPDERSDLIAYLDGELPEAHARAISTKLSLSPTARREVEILQKTWDLLEQLPRPQLAPEFSEKTIHTIQRLEARSSVWSERAALWGQRGVIVSAYLLIALAGLAAGYAVVRLVLPNPTERLVTDLSLAENLEVYLEIGSTEFLDALVESRAFGLSSP